MTIVKRGRRFGVPQVVAVLLLLAFLAQAAWLAARTPLSAAELRFVHSSDAAPDGGLAPAPWSPLTHVAARAFFSARGQNADPPEIPSSQDAEAVRAATRARMPFLIFGTLLGASLWYVARRLYGNTGGYIALALYAFSPVMIAHSARVDPAMGAAWGVFGCVFTGIAVSHTLYAPREVVLWNWKRILMLGIITGVGVASLFSAVVAVPIALALMWYVVPERRGAALAIMLSGCAVAFIVLWAACGFQPGVLATHARAIGIAEFAPRVRETRIAALMLGLFLLRDGPGFALLLMIALGAYAGWRRPRFFGNAAPLLVLVLLVALSVTLPHTAGYAFLVLALPFAFLFIAGLSVDLLETRLSSLALGVVLAALVAQAYFSISGLVKLVK